MATFPTGYLDRKYRISVKLKISLNLQNTEKYLLHISTEPSFKKKELQLYLTIVLGGTMLQWKILEMMIVCCSVRFPKYLHI